MRRLFAICGAVALLAIAGCSTVDRFLGGGSSVIEEAAPEEQPSLRVIAASLIVKGAYNTIEQQLDAGLIDRDTAAAVKARVDKAAVAVDVAAAAVERGGGGSELALADEAVRGFLTSSLFTRKSP